LRSNVAKLISRNVVSIKSKLYAGFAFLVLIAVALTVYAITEFNGIKTNVVKMNALADNTARIMEIEDDFEKMRRSVLRYAYDHDEASAKENGEVANKAITTLREAAEATLSEDRRKLYNGLQADVAATQNERNRCSPPSSKCGRSRKSCTRSATR
jgi:Four helix bundle sensory module for signal transduction